MRRLFLVRLDRWWRAFVWALGAYAIIGAVTLVVAPSYAGVFLLGAYCIPSNSILPIPHEPAVLFFSRYYDPLWIALAATVGSIIATFADYALVGAAVQHRFFRKTRESRLFRWALAGMKRWPFAIIVLFSFTPLPISVVRILAPASEYPIGRYVAAQVVGRLPRFYLLAWIGHTVMIPTWIVLVLLAVLVAAVLLGARDTAGDEVPEPDAADSVDLAG